MGSNEVKLHAYIHTYMHRRYLQSLADQHVRGLRGAGSAHDGHRAVAAAPTAQLVQLASKNNIPLKKYS